jgi:hypothetical protein
MMPTGDATQLCQPGHAVAVGLRRLERDGMNCSAFILHLAYAG